MKESRSGKPFYVVGGTLRPGTTSYVERSADEELPQRLQAGDFCYVLTSRQMGKSSLMVRTHRRFQQQGIHSATVDLTKLGTEEASADRWYYGFAHLVLKELRLEADLGTWWGGRDRLPPVQRLVEFFEDVVLPATQGRVVVFVDEIDSTLPLPYSDDFFAALRACFNARATEPAFERLSFAFFGVAAPSELIKDPHRTPFNVGHRVELSDFTLEEAAPLARGLGADSESCTRILQRVLFWTGGHPYLTQRLCGLLAERPGGASCEADVDETVEGSFLEAEARREDDNLKDVRRRLLAVERKAAALVLYRKVRAGKQVEHQALSAEQMVLKLCGLVIPTAGGRLRVRNRIYESVFDETWIRGEIPADWSRRLAWAAVLLFLVTTGVWYWGIYPQAFTAQIRTAQQDVPRDARARLAGIPGYGGVADRLYAEFFDRRALELERAEDGDRALLLRLKALAIAPSRERRVQPGNLAGASYELLERSFRHAGPVNAVAFSPNGKRVLTGSRDNTARVWNAQSGEPISQPMQHGSSVLSVAFSPNGKRVLTGSRDNTARVWNAATGEPISQPMQHGSSVLSVAFSPNGKRVLTGSDDGTSRVWNALTGEPIAPALQHGLWVRSVAFSPDGELVLTGSLDNTARVWNARTGEPISPPLQHGTLVRSVAFSPDSKLVLTGSLDNTARVWNARTGEPISSPLRHGSSVVSVAFGPDGEFVLTGSLDNTARVWNAQTGEPISPPLQHGSGVRSVAFSPDGEFVLTGSEDNTARVWNARTGEPISPPLLHGGWVRSVAFSPDGERVLTGSEDRTARVWNAQTGEPIALSLQHDGWVRSVAFSPDGERVLTGSLDNTARVWNARTGEPISPRMQHDGWVRSVAFSPDGERVLTGSEDRTARVWNAQTGEPISPPLRHGGWVVSVAFGPDGECVLTGSLDRTARVWNAQTGERISQRFQHGDGVLGVAFSPDGERVLTGSLDNTAQVWNVQTGERISQRFQHGGGVLSVAFSPDGERVLTGSSDATARVWSAQTGEPISQPMQHGDGVRSVGFSPDGEHVLTGSSDATARVWSAETGEPISQPMQHGDGVRSVGFSPDGELGLIVTRRWAHLYSLQSPAAPEHLASGFLGLFYDFPARFPRPGKGRSVRIPWYFSKGSLVLLTVGTGAQDGAGLEGDPGDLVDEAQRKLGLRFDEEDRLVETYPTAVANTKSRDAGLRGPE